MFYHCAIARGFKHLRRTSACALSSGEPVRKKEMEELTTSPLTRVLFCGPYFPASHTYTKEYLQNHEFIQVDDVPFAEVPQVISNYQLCVVKNMALDSTLISKAKQMKVIMQYGVGVEGVDIDAASKCGIKVARIPSDSTGNAASCAELAIYLILGLLRKQKTMEVSIELGKLGEPIGDSLFAKTVFIMGFGNIGIELARRLRGFGVKIIATKRRWLPNQHSFSELVDEMGDHEEIHKFAAKADIVVCCLVMNKDTNGIVDESFISSMKRGALLVNVARGKLLQYEAVLRNLQCGKLGGVGIDVAWYEPFDSNDPILKMDNFMITPHIAGVTEHSYRYMAKVVGDVAIQLHKGHELTGIEVLN